MDAITPAMRKWIDENRPPHPPTDEQCAQAAVLFGPPKKVERRPAPKDAA